MAVLDAPQLIAKLQTLVDYADTADIAKARELRTVCMQLMVVLPMRTRAANQELDLNVNAIKDILNGVNGWISANELALAGHPSYRKADLRNFRE